MFREQFAFSPHALVNFVGGGGKTGLIRKLMQEFSAQGPVFCTTTTRIHPPDPREEIALLSSDNTDLLGKMVDSIVHCCPEHPYKLAVARSYLSPTLLRGVPPDFDSNVDSRSFPILLNEADGSAGFSLKMPRDGEPVLMEDAQYLVPVVGLDCLHQPIDAQTIFRFEKFLEHFSEHARGRITAQLTSDVLMHPQGVCKGWKPGMHIIPFINKVDSAGQEADAEFLARKILSNANFPVDRVVYGSIFFDKALSVCAG